MSKSVYRYNSYLAVQKRVISMKNELLPGHPNGGDSNETAGYRSGVAARLAGLSAATLRVWERRYQLTATQRSATGQRLYTPGQVRRLGLLKQLVDRGHPIGTLAALAPERLLALCGAASPLTAGEEPSQSLIAATPVAAIGAGLVRRLAGECGAVRCTSGCAGPRRRRGEGAADRTGGTGQPAAGAVDGATGRGARRQRRRRGGAVVPLLFQRHRARLAGAGFSGGALSGRTGRASPVVPRRPAAPRCRAPYPHRDGDPGPLRRSGPVGAGGGLAGRWRSGGTACGWRAARQRARAGGRAAQYGQLRTLQRPLRQ